MSEWGPGHPTLYDLVFTLREGGEVVDSAASYFGLRSLRWDGQAILLNGRPVFQRLILDQGFYPDGIWTAPSDADLRQDIERSQAMGFNGARLHQKVFEERFLYWADRLGYMVWGEMGDWGIDLADARAVDSFLTEWQEVMARDYSHPAIVGWCPLNERGNWGFQAEYIRHIFRTTRRLDPTRPVIDTSGYCHVETEVYDSHDYDQNPDTFEQRHAPFATGGDPYRSSGEKEAPYQGQPYMVSEYGGIWWNPDQKDEVGWGYGDRPKSEAEFLARFTALTTTLLNHPRMCGFCYTQLTNVEQEVNGLYTYDRKPKFDPARIREVVARRAAVEG